MANSWQPHPTASAPMLSVAPASATPEDQLSTMSEMVMSWAGCSDLGIWKKNSSLNVFHSWFYSFTQHQPLWWFFPYVHWHINQNIPELSRTAFWDPISMFPQKKPPTISHPSHLPRCSAWPLPLRALRALRQGQGGGGVARGDAGDAFHEAGVAWEIARGFPKNSQRLRGE